ncbi:hypothetical protein HYPSUDRAFT_141104 [Hypholoma sublateritium FD-334 SS-4]|uniref:DUF2415 domain-containing protein n=1 Tax=Hypholoma sublateritium (strain FD-334 SS-4) TaxID=945553 RepID=A0A0D2NXM0_HYPSF|nr:hypothetical protein HYPSUDRAFT_141104 [Hypholoma sublateritium FD-334 SS-4]
MTWLFLSRKLQAHKSCVNALTFSSGAGRYLASGGDGAYRHRDPGTLESLTGQPPWRPALDLRILLWDFHQDDVKAPSHTLRGPKGNIFCLNFSATNRFILSGGTCETVFKYDIGALGTAMAPIKLTASPDSTYKDHSDNIRALTSHPTQDDIFMSASEDGSIVRYDGREPTQRRARSQNVIQTENEVTGLQYHPLIENIFVSSDGAGRVCLRDTRMAFGPLTKRSNEGIYNTKLTRRPILRACNPESNSIVFDKEGTKLAVTFLHYQPTIYALSDPNPLAVLSGANLPDGTPKPPEERTYSNSCTMKHGSFGGPGLDIDDMYAAGSDDFRGYVWKIPSISQLTTARKELSGEDWFNMVDSEQTTVAFSEGRKERKYIPVEISTPFCRLTGHNSIVNTTIFHPHFLQVVTAGIEKDIILHSPTPTSPCAQDLQPSPTNVRRLRAEVEEEDRINYLSALLSPEPTTVGDLASERQTISLFDHIIREEGTRDVFSQRPWRSPTSSDSEADVGSVEGGSEMDDDSDSPADILLPGYTFL